MATVGDASTDRAERTDQVLHLFEAHGAAVYRTAYAILGQEADAQDATQNVFLYLLHKPATLHRVSFTDAWLHRAAANAAIALLRRQASRHRRLEGMTRRRLEAMRDERTSGEQGILIGRLRQLVAQMPEKLRMALVLHYFRGLSCREAAEALHCSVTTVTTRLERAKAKLREGLAQTGYTAVVSLDQALSGMPASMPAHVSDAVTSILRSPRDVAAPAWSPPGRALLPVAGGVVASLLGVALLAWAFWGGGLPDKDQTRQVAGASLPVPARAVSEAPASPPNEVSARGEGQLASGEPLSSTGPRQKPGIGSAVSKDVQTGVVLSSKDVPIEGAMIEVAWHTVDGAVLLDPAGTAVASGSEGRFPLPTSGHPLMLRARHPDFAPAGTIVAVPSSARIVMEVGLRHGGLVVDAASGSPIVGAKVSVQGGGSSAFDLCWTPEAHTGGEGGFRLPPLPDVDVFSLRVEHADYLSLDQVIGCRESDCEHRLRMAPISGHSLLVSVLTPDGGATPAGAEVTVVVSGSSGMSHGEPFGTRLLDAHGEANFQGLGPGEVEIWATAPGHAREWVGTTIADGENKVSVRLGKGETLGGRLVHEGTKEPVPGVAMGLLVTPDWLKRGDFDREFRKKLRKEFFTMGQWFVIAATSDSDGRFSLTIPVGGRGAYSVQILQEAYAFHTFPVPESESGEWQIELPQPVRADPVSGRVVDSEGNPVQGAVILTGGMLTAVGVPGGQAAATDGDGRFQLRLKSQFDEVNIRAAGFLDRQFLVADAEALEDMKRIHSYNEVLGLDSLKEVILFRPRIVRGHLVPMPGPAEYVMVVLIERDRPTWGGSTSVEVGPDGRFSLPISESSEGELVVLDSRFDRWETGVTIPTAEEEVVLTWRTGPPPRVGSVRFIITDAATGEPVELYRLTLQEGGRNLVNANTPDPDPGHTSFEKVAAGAAWVKIEAEGYLSQEILVEVAASNTVEQHVTLQPVAALGKGTLELQLMGVDGVVEGFATILQEGSYYLDEPVKGTPDSEEPGLFVWPELLEGRYSLAFLTSDGVLSGGVFQVAPGRSTRAVVDGENRGTLVASMFPNWRGWVQVSRDGTVMGSCSSKLESRVYGMGQVSGDLKILLGPGPYEVTTNRPAGFQTRSAVVRQGEETVVELP